MQRTLATRLLSGGRMALGLAMLAAPEKVGEGWVGAAAARGGGTIALRAVGVRDVVLGLGTLLADRDGDAARWLEAGIVADVADTFSTLAAMEDVGTQQALGSAAVAAAAAGAGLWLRLGMD